MKRKHPAPLPPILSRSLQRLGASGIERAAREIEFFDYLFGVESRYHAGMKPTSKRLLFWTPRVLCLLFAAFISIFALDVFEEGFQGWRTLLALLMHLIPTFLILLVLVLSWRWEWIGALVFSGLAACYVAFFWGRFHWSAYAAISGPLCLLGVLFLVNWRWRAELRPGA